VKILGIETSCDETGAAVVEDGRRVISNVVASQVRIHARYGGIVPEVASRHHLEALVPVVEATLQEARCRWSDLDAVAVTYGPGLSGSLLVGVNLAKALAFAHSLPLVGIHHLEAHNYANWLEDGGAPPQGFPALALIVSGAHTDLVLMEEHGRYCRLGRTRDDAAGEAFDKVGRFLGLGFPGGPAIEKEAARLKPVGRPSLRLPRAWLGDAHDFSFSGLKTAVLRLARQQAEAGGGGQTLPVAEIAAAFQEAVVDVLVTKTVRAARREGVSQVLLSGGVAANTALREALVRRSPVPVRVPPPALCTDNGAMVAGCAYYRIQRGASSGLDLDIFANLPIA
jgi:N6-L-threonylcarbamoyladenine synthase